MNPDPQSYTNLNADAANEADPDARFSFQQDRSEAHHRASTSGDQVPNSGFSVQANSNNSEPNQNPGHPQKKELSSGETYFYGGILAMNILTNGLYVLNILQAASLGLGFDQLEFVATAWILRAVIIAFMGLWNKDLGKIESALTMIKIHFPFLVRNQLNRISQAASLQQRYGVRNNPGLEIIFALAWSFAGWYSTFQIKGKIRNTWKPVPQEEEVRNEQAQDADPIDKLDSVKFTIYKYAILLISCLEAKISIEGIYDDFSDFPKFCGKMMSETSYLVTQLYLYPLFPLSMVITFLAFEGLRRKNLQKVLTSIKLMKIHLAVRFVMQTLSIIIRYYERTLKKTYGNSQDRENDAIFNSFIFVLFSAVHTSMWIDFTSQVRDILKAHERARHTL